MEQGKFAYQQNLEAARKALLDRGSRSQVPDASQQVVAQKEGLMRPRAQPKPEASGLAQGMGMALMESFQSKEEDLADAEKARAAPTATQMGGSGPDASGRPTARGTDDIYDGLVARGLPKHVAKGFVLNFQDESGMDSGINEANPLVKGSRGGFGLYQLTGPRRVEYEDFAASKGVAPSNVDAQLDFLVMELNNKEKSAGDAIMATNNAGEAAAAIVNKFLRPSKQYRENRANKYLNSNI
tara:strand:- start:3837 stop:4559 length:723 start_codon:yes stop_codon:yes gene_type:complete